MPLQVGDKLGRYDILAPLGAGGMGEVYKAKDSRLSRMVAIKVLKSRFSSRFEQEARAIAAFSHAHICTLYDVGPDYLVMEYIEGRRLQGKYQPEEALRLAIQMAEALEEAHRKGIVHLDLKPANIMVTAGGSIKLLDFGLARLTRPTDTDLTQSMEATAGTVGYMSPEQARGEPVDGRSDIFSFGAVLYEMLAGRPAFEGDSVAAVLSALLTKRPAPMQASPALERIVIQCLDKDPALRFQNMPEVRTALQEFTAAPAARHPSIAVLAFADMSAAQDNEYFSDGLTEEIINALAHVQGLKVIARTSAFAFKGKNEDIRHIAGVLGVGHVLEGSVRRSGNRIRVTAQLISSSDGSHLWSERYDREMADVFAMQDEIASAIAEALELKLTPQPAASRHTPLIPAYEAYMLGLYQSFKTTPESIARAAQTLQEAAQLDPAYALPHSAQGLLHLMTAAWGLRPAHEAMPLIRAAALRALHLDPHLSDAHALLGLVAAMYDYDWLESERRFGLAFGAARVSDFARIVYANYYLLPLGRTGEAVEQMERVLESDPLNVLYRSLLGVCLHGARARERAGLELAKALDIEGNHWTIYAVSSWNYAGAGMLDEARTAAENAYRLAPWQSQAIGVLAGLLSRTEDAERAEQLLWQLRELPAHRIPLGMTMYHLLRSEPDAAIEWMEKAIEQRDVWAARFPRLMITDILRSHSRWPVLMQAMNLPEST
jgi:TolB-like protein/predicted Ser/Thr protein kinase